MEALLFDEYHSSLSLRPFTFTRPTALMRLGILTLQEKWEKQLGQPLSLLAHHHLRKAFPEHYGQDNLLINGAILPNDSLIRELKQLKTGQWLAHDGTLVGARLNRTATEDFAQAGNHTPTQPVEVSSVFRMIRRPYDLFLLNAEEIENDFALLTQGRQSARIQDPHTRVYCPDRVFVEAGAEIRNATLNAETGPIYIGKEAHIHEGALIRGAFALLEGAHANMGVKIKGDTTVGPHAKVGGEVSNSLIFGYSNKSHDGFLGNSVLGEWCNLGADTNSSNLKNNYAPIRVWNYQGETFQESGQQFCGLLMGDHAKCGINTMFNTGTVVGVGANVFGGGFPPKFIPDFAWGGINALQDYRLPKFFEAEARMMDRRKKAMSPEYQQALQWVFESTQHLRDQLRV